MAEEFPFTRGELLAKLSKFSYHADAIKLISSIDRQLSEIQDRIEMYPAEEKYLLTKQDKVSHQLDLTHRRALTRQRERMWNKLMELEKSIREDIASLKE